MLRVAVGASLSIRAAMALAGSRLLDGAGTGVEVPAAWLGSAYWVAVFVTESQVQAVVPLTMATRSPFWPCDSRRTLPSCSQRRPEPPRSSDESPEGVWLPPSESNELVPSSPLLQVNSPFTAVVLGALVATFWRSCWTLIGGRLDDPLAPAVTTPTIRIAASATPAIRMNRVLRRMTAPSVADAPNCSGSSPSMPRFERL